MPRAQLPWALLVIPRVPKVGMSHAPEGLAARACLRPTRCRASVRLSVRPHDAAIPLTLYALRKRITRPRSSHSGLLSAACRRHSQ